MEFLIKEISKPTSDEILEITKLWSVSFGDETDFILDFFNKMPVHSVVCCFLCDRLVGMTVLLTLEKAYYGYAVCTDPDFRGRGICRMIHDYIRKKCDGEGFEYFIHPADASLVSFYEKIGMRAVLSSYETAVLADKSFKVRKIDSGEYAFARYLYFGGCCFYSWTQEALAFMGECGVSYLSCMVDGTECFAAVDSDMILELCAPEELIGKCAGAFIEGSEGKLRLLTQPNHVDAPCLMSFSGRYSYFNLFFE